MTIEEIKAEYPYIYETHLHTSEGSACGKSSGKDMARAHKEAGYTGIIVTDHNWGGNTAIDIDLPWKQWVNDFFAGYRSAKQEGDKIGLQVFCGYEAGYNATEFLIYGVTPEWLAEHEEMKTASIEEQYNLVHEAGGIVIHAHPYREEWYIPEIRLYPDLVDGIEMINATHSNSKSQGHNNPEFDTKAIAYAREYNFPVTAGSDVHTAMAFGGGMAFKTKLTDMQDFMNRIKNGDDYVLTNGECWYSKTGEVLAKI